MRKVTTTIALLALVGTSVAIAQRARSSMNPDKQLHDKSKRLLAKLFFSTCTMQPGLKIKGSPLTSSIFLWISRS